jgi:hypothetical protein
MTIHDAIEYVAIAATFLANLFAISRYMFLVESKIDLLSEKFKYLKEEIEELKLRVK